MELVAREQLRPPLWGAGGGEKSAANQKSGMSLDLLTGQQPPALEHLLMKYPGPL